MKPTTFRPRRTAHKTFAVAASVILAACLHPLLFPPASGAQSGSLSTSIVFGGGGGGLTTLPAQAPYTSLSATEVVFRLENFSSGPQTQVVLATPSFLIYIAANSTWMKAYVAGNNHQAEINASGQSLFKFTWDSSSRQMVLESWDGSGGNHRTSGAVISDATGPVNVSGSVGVGRWDWTDSGWLAQGTQLAWLRWRSGQGTVGTAPSNCDTAPYNVARWEFEGNGNDSSGHGFNLALNGSNSYTPTPGGGGSCGASCSLSNSVVFGGSGGLLATLPAQAPYTSLSATEVVFRLDNISVRPQAQIVFSAANILIYVEPNQTWMHAYVGGNNHQADLNISGQSLFKFTWDSSSRQMVLESWDGTGGDHRTSGPVISDAAGPVNVAGSVGIGRWDWTDSGWLAQGTRMAWLRWRNGQGTVGAAPTNCDTAPYNVARWEFEGNGNDSSGNGFNLTSAAGAGLSYAATPGFTSPPFARGGDDRTAKPGQTVGLDASGTYSQVGNVSYSWVQLSGTAVALSGANTAAPSFTAPTPSGDMEELVFRVTAADANGSTTADVAVGVVKVGANDRVQISDPVVAFLVGPQVLAGSPLIPNVERFERKFNEEGLHWGAQFPAIPPVYDPARLAGTVSVTSGSTSVVGAGTTFTQDIEMAPGVSDYFRGNIWIYDGSGYVLKRVASVADDTHLTLASAWAGPTAQGREFHTAPNNSDLITFDRYDLARIFYQQFYRTGLTKWRALARKVADSHWRSESYWYGTVTEGNMFPPPYNAVEAGAIMRAYDGKPERWDYLYRLCKDSRFVPRVYNKRTAAAWPGPRTPGDTRDMGWITEWFAMVVKAMPASYGLYANGTNNPPTGQATYTAAQRAADVAMLEEAFTGVFKRLQTDDGSWRYDVDNGCDGCPLLGITQPFMEGITLQALARVRELSANQTVRADILTVMKKSLDFLHTTYGQTTSVTNCASLVGCVVPTYWRASPYFVHGGPTASPNQYDPPYHFGASGTDNAPDISSGDGSVRGARGQQPFWLYPAGYYYAATGDATYKARGDEYYDSVWGSGDGGGTYGVYWYATADRLSDKEKDFGEAYHNASLYLTYRLTP